MERKNQERPEQQRPIALLDSGVGGLTVASAVSRQLPAERLIYYGDTLHLPYGPRHLEEVRGFVSQIADYLYHKQQAKAIIIACNTATSAALELVGNHYPVPVFGTISGATIRAYQLTEKGRVGIIGTEGTVNSQAYQRSLLEIDQELEVFAAACPRFVELVEGGRFDGPEVEQVARRYLEGLKQVGIDVLILGCTHFPYLRPVIQRVMGKGVQLVGSNIEIAREVSQTLEQKNLLRAGSRSGKLSDQELIVSDKHRISRLFLERGRKFLRLPDLDFREVNIFTGGGKDE
ncbi:MAG: glutamate racemase [Bacillota bacterium]